MATQSIQPQSPEMVSSTKLNKPTVNKQNSAARSFDSVMDNSMKNKSNIIKQDQVKVTVKDQKTFDNKASVDDVSNQISKAVNKQETANIQTSANTDNNQENVSSLQEKVDKVTEDLSNTIKKTLNITDEDLNKALETLGFTMLDLLNVDNLKQLVLQVNGSDNITAALTNENLANSMQNVVEAVENLMSSETFALTQEELNAIMSQNALDDVSVTKEPKLETSMFKQVLEANSETTNDKNSNIKAQNADSTSLNQKEITIEVQKITSDNSSLNSNSDSQSSKNNQHKMELQTPIETFVNNLVVAGNENTQSFTEQIETVRVMQDITKQIVEQIKVIIKPEHTSMELQLNPENLGKINLSVVSKDGVMTAQFTAQNQLAKEAIESQMQVLKENLNNQGLKVESIEVNVSNFGFDQGNQTAAGEGQKNSNSQKGNRFRSDNEILGNSTEEETVPVNSVELNGNSIDYTA